MDDQLKSSLFEYIEMKNNGATEIELLECRVRALESYLLILLTRERATLSDSQRRNSKFDKELAIIADALKSLAGLDGTRN